MNQELLGRRLRDAREALGINQQEAADSIGVPRTAITQIEAANRSVSTVEIMKLAALYHKSVSYFLDENLDEEEDILVALHRIAPGLERDPAIQHQVNHCLELCQEGASLERLLGRDELFNIPSYPEKTPHKPSEAVLQGERAADQERRRLGIGSAPIADMSDLIASQGIWASGADLPDEMSGLFLHHSSVGIAILVNANHARARKRFSYAHEYAHALLDRAHSVTVSSVSNAAELIEKRANAFAAAFLMPANGIADLLVNLDKGQPSRAEKSIFDVATGGRIEAECRPTPRSQQITYQDIAMIAHHFGVSYQAAVYRLKSLKHISSEEIEHFLALESSGRSLLKALHMFDDLEAQEDKRFDNREIRSQLVHLAIEAYRRGEISRGKLRDISKTVAIEASILIDLAEAACNTH